jgi:hypothetical protein
MTRKYSALGVGLIPALTLLSACALQSPEETLVGASHGQKQQHLIGGELAPADHFRSTVGIANRCTAAKVGARLFLTAAHCVDAPRGRLPPGTVVREDGLAEDFAPGATIPIHYGLSPTDGQVGQFSIVATTIHPSWLASTAETPPKDVNGAAADIAVFEIEEETPFIPEAQVSLDRLAVGAEVVKLGWGCETRANDPDHVGLLPYKTSAAWIVPVDHVDHEQDRGTFFSDLQLESIDDAYSITAGHAQDADLASLCPGDSGGPLYLPDSDERIVVGVNSDYTFLPVTDPEDLGGVSWTDWHTRTSLDSRHATGAWLVELGVNTIGGDTPGGSGGITMERWNGVGGVSVNLVPIYRPADSTQVIPDFEIYPGSSNNGDNYGVRVRGYLTPQVTGAYVLSVAGDDHASLRIAPDEHSYNAQIVASHTGWTAPRQWTKYASQRSAPIQLVAGQRYYIEANVKEAYQGDNLAVGWNLPGQHHLPPVVIPGTVLSPIDPPATSACTCPSGCDSIVNAAVPMTTYGTDEGCYFFEELGYSINSFGMNQVNLNGLSIPNQWVGNWAFPEEIDDGYYLYVAPNFPWSQTQLAE